MSRVTACCIERLGVRPEHLPLAQRGEVHHGGLLAAGPVLGDAALVVVAVRQPVAAVLDEALGQLARARVEGGLLGQHWLGLRGHAMGDRRREAVLGRVDANVDVGDLPPVGGIDVVGAGRRRADEVVHRAQQHVVAGARPGLVDEQHVVAVEGGVVEEVERLPALALGDPVGRDLAVEVLGAARCARDSPCPRSTSACRRGANMSWRPTVSRTTWTSGSMSTSKNFCRGRASG